LDDTIAVDADKCDQCGKCAESCVVAHYFDKMAGGLAAPDRKERAGKSG
jgi:ferredoxin